MPASKTAAAKTDKAAKDEVKKPVKATAAEEVIVKKKPGRPPKAASAVAGAAATAPAKRGRKPKAATASGKVAGGDEEDLSDVVAEYAEDETVAEAAETTTEKVKPLRMKISKAKERALMKEFGL
ncbi:MAG: RNA polymerase sigma factor RpoD, partial [Pseudomonadota bacterium]